MFSKNGSSKRGLGATPGKADETSSSAKSSDPIKTASEGSERSSGQPGSQTSQASRNATPGVPSIISKDLRIKGNLESNGELQIDGGVTGDILGTRVVVGQSGNIVGNIQGDWVRVAGKVSGSINARKIELDQLSRVAGDLANDDLTVAAGAQFEGRAMPSKSMTPLAGDTAKPQNMTQEKQEPAVAAPAAPSGKQDAKPEIKSTASPD